MKRLLLVGDLSALLMLVAAVAYAADTVGPGPMGSNVGSIPQFPMQTKNMFLGSPSTADGIMMPRLLTPADMPGSGNNVVPTSTLGTITAGSTNLGGQVTGAVSGATTAVDVVFATGGFPNFAYCVVTPSNAAAKALAPYISSTPGLKTGLTITYTAGASAAYNFNCEGN